MTRILLIGAHGKVAQLATPLLVARGHDVTGVVRAEDQTERIAELGATPLVLDVGLATSDELVEAFQGHDAVVWSAGAGGRGGAERTYSIDRDAAIRTMDAASAAGVRRYVMVSFVGAVPDHGVPRDDSFFPYTDAKVTADEHLRASDLDWTILGPGTLTDDSEATSSIDVIPEGEPTPDGGAPVSRANVALVLARVLESPGSVGRFLRFGDGATPVEVAVPIGG